MAENEPILLPEGGTVTYAAIRKATLGQDHTMSLAGEHIQPVVEAVNKGIDSHLEACNGPDDEYRFVGSKRLDCRVSPKSLPTLIRRLFEAGDEELDDGTSAHIAEDILTAIGIHHETGQFVG